MTKSMRNLGMDLERGARISRPFALIALAKYNIIIINVFRKRRESICLEWTASEGTKALMCYTK